MAIAFAGLLLGACNEIEENERFLDTPLSALQRTVLLEEFTGQNCPNCPEGAKQAAKLQEMFGDKVVVVGIHAGAFAKGSEFETAAGQAYWEKFYANGNSIGYPAAIINRDGKVSTGYQSEWSSSVITAGMLPSSYEMDMKVDFDEAAKSVKVISSLKKVLGVTNNQTKLVYLLTESKLINYQASGGSYVFDYEHNHVLRGAIGDKDETPNYWGTDVAVGTKDETIVESAEYVLDANWNPANMHVIGLLYDAQTFEALQVVEVPMVVK